MNKRRAGGLWTFKEAKAPRFRDKFILLTLMIAGFLSMINLADWWFREEHVNNLILYILLTLIFWWGILRMLISWIGYLRISKPKAIPAPEGMSVAIFTTSSPGEPLSMFEKTLEACANIQYPHTTYLLDDTEDERFRKVAEKHGAVWLELVGLPGAKAGKVNAALKITSEDFILILDPDHIPFPEFLHHTLGYFKDENVGYVQVSQAYYNQYRSFTARAAAEQTYTFYGPTQMGMHGFNAAVAIGANCTFRRKALESIGGHGIGLAEDLVTAIRIHGKKWKTVYNPVIVSRGLVPEDFGSFCKQQLKWSRGVHEVLFAEVPALFSTLSFWQKLSYIAIGTYYINGLSLFTFLIIPFLFFWFNVLPANMYLVNFLIRWLPLAGFGTAIYLFVQRWMCDPATEKGLHWRGMILKFANWPVYLLGFLLSLINKKIPYIPTAKKAARGLSPFARPMMLHILIFLITVCFVVIYRLFYTPESVLSLTSEQTWGMIGFASIAFVMAVGALFAAFESSRLDAAEPWQKINVNDL